MHTLPHIILPLIDPPYLPTHPKPISLLIYLPIYLHNPLTNPPTPTTSQPCTCDIDRHAVLQYVGGVIHQHHAHIVHPGRREGVPRQGGTIQGDVYVALDI